MSLIKCPVCGACFTSELPISEDGEVFCPRCGILIKELSWDPERNGLENRDNNLVASIFERSDLDDGSNSLRGEEEYGGEI